MTDAVLSGLTKRRLELLAEAKATDPTLRRIMADIEHIDGAIRTYDSAYRPRKVVANRAKRVELSRIVLGILRKATAPMSLRDITLAIMGQRGEDREDAKLVRYRMEKVRAVVLRQRVNGALRSEQGPGLMLMWGVVAAGA